eukprot:m51a1_g10212 hypothetical protein (1405) ;mRNA; f:95238-99763
MRSATPLPRALVLCSALLALAAPCCGARSGRALQLESPQNALSSSPLAGSADLVALTLALWIRVSAKFDLNDLLVTYMNVSSGRRFFTFDTGFRMWGAYLVDSTLVGYTDGYADTQRWQHAAVTWRSSDGLTNAEEVGNTTDLGTGLAFPAGCSLVVPDRQWGLGAYVQLDEVALYDAALDPPEIRQLYFGSAARPEARALHWSFDQLDGIADDGYRATGDAQVWEGWAGDLTVPSTCPNVDTSATWVVAEPAVPERVAIREEWDVAEVTVTSLPAHGVLLHEGTMAAVRVGDQAATVLYVGASDLLNDSFTTSRATVLVQRNRWPVPHDQSISVPQGRTGIIFTAFADWRGLTDASPERFFQEDADGDLLLAYVVALPAVGRLFQVLEDDQTAGEQITAVPARVLNVNSLVVWDPSDADVFSNSTFAVVVSDGRVNTSAAVFSVAVDLPIDPPRVEPVAANMTEDGAPVFLDLVVVGDPLGETTFTVTRMPAKGTLHQYNESAPGRVGPEVAAEQREEILHQWAVRANASSVWPNYPAERACGPPDWYPSYGDSPSTWTPISGGLVDEWLLLEYEVPVFATAVEVYETYSVDSVWRVSLLLEGLDEWLPVFQRPKRSEASAEQSQVFSPPLLQGFFPYRTRAVLLDVWGVQDDAIEIDAVKLVGTRSTTAAPVASGHKVVYVPHANANGLDSFSYSIDSIGASQIALLERVPFYSSPEPADVAVDIAPVEDPPVLDDASALANITGIVSPGGLVPVPINGTDPDGDAVVVVVDALPRNGDLVDAHSGASLRLGGVAPAVSYRPRCSWTRPEVRDAFALRLSDGQMLSVDRKLFRVVVECNGMRTRQALVIAVCVCAPVLLAVAAMVVAAVAHNVRANRMRLRGLELEKAELQMRAAELERQVAFLGEDSAYKNLLQTPAEMAVTQLTDIMDTKCLSEEHKMELQQIIRLIRRNRLYEVSIKRGEVADDDEVAKYLRGTVMASAKTASSDSLERRTDDLAELSRDEDEVAEDPGQPTDIALTLAQISVHQLVSALSRLLADWDFHPRMVELRPGLGQLSEVVLAVVESRGLFAKFGIPLETFMRWLCAIESGYLDNPYHNATHAADVTQAMNWLITCVAGDGMPFSDLELLAAVVACAVHDYGHPGVNSNFLWASRSPIAVRYNGISALENMHIAESFGLMLHGRCDSPASSAGSACAGVTPQTDKSGAYNWMAQAPRDVFDQLHKLVVQLVLATDMAQHVAILGEANAAFAVGGSLNWQRGSDRLLLLKLMIKVSDLSNALRPWKTSEEWSRLVCSEFFAQGDRERELGLPISPFMDRNNAQVPKMQKTFLDLLVRPLVEVLVRAVPDAQPLLDRLQHNRSQWAQQMRGTTAVSVTSGMRSASFSSCAGAPAFLHKKPFLTTN